MHDTLPDVDWYGDPNDTDDVPTQIDMWTLDHDAVIAKMKSDMGVLRRKLKRILAGQQVYSV